MFFNPLEIPEALVDAQEQGKLVIFAGAGVSKGEPSCLPDFEELAIKIAGSHPREPEISKYKARVDSFLGELFRDGVDVQGRCREIIGVPASKPNELHHSLVDLFKKPEHVRIVTTNFDTHFGAASLARGWNPDCYYAPALPLGHQFSGIVYLHGSICRPNEPLILTDEDFGRAYLTEGWAREFLQRLFVEFTTLFVGYSHNDTLVEYLARGMSGRSLAPRFALVPAGETGRWKSLRIQEIRFEETPDGNRYKNLYSGVKTWAEFSKRQPTGIAEMVKNIVSAPEDILPGKSESSLLKRCLECEGTCHFFTEHARGWRWVKWLFEQKLLSIFFDASVPELPRPKVELALWLARALLEEKSDKALRLIGQHQSKIGPCLWGKLSRELRLENNVDWSSPLIQKWVIFLADTCPADRTGELVYLLPKAIETAPRTLGMVLLRRITAFRMVVSEGIDFGSMLSGGEAFCYSGNAELEIATTGDMYELDCIWEDCFKPRLSGLREPLLLLLENRLREAHELYRTAERSDAAKDPFCRRGRIYQQRAFGRGPDVIIDMFLDVLEDGAKQENWLSETRLVGWLNSEIPVMIRLGLYALHLSKSVPNLRKVELILERHLLFPTVFGGTHESWLVLSNCYASLETAHRKTLWQAINQGPTEKHFKNQSAQEGQEKRQDLIDSLTWFLATKNPSCPEATTALAALKQRQPNFKGFEGMDQVFFEGESLPQGPRTPKSATDLLSSEPASQIHWLLNYKGGKAPLEETRAGLVRAVGVACAQNVLWGVSLLQELNNQQAWKTDLWDAAFWRINLTALPQDKLAWLLKVLEDHFCEFKDLTALSVFLVNVAVLFDEKRPSDENLDRLIRLSLLIWKQLQGAEEVVTKDFGKEEWFNQSINHPAGRIAEFWLSCCKLSLHKSGGQVGGFPKWFKQPLDDMVAGKDYASQLGRAALGGNLDEVYRIDPAWTISQLLPKFDFSKVGDEAFLMWEPYASHGGLSRDLMVPMVPLYREAFPHFRGVDPHLQASFSRKIAGIVFSCVFDVNEGNWLRDFITGLSEQERANWAGQLKSTLEFKSDQRKLQLWKRWMKAYWEDRLQGLPCPLAPKETEQMFKWAFVVGEAFPEAVDLVINGPRIQPPFSEFFLVVKEHEAPTKYPKEFLRLLDWLLQSTDRNAIGFTDINLIFDRVPKKKILLPLLNSICQHLASRGYKGAKDLEDRLDAIFSEE